MENIEMFIFSTSLTKKIMSVFYHMKELLHSLKTVEKPTLTRMTNKPPHKALIASLPISPEFQNISQNSNINEIIDSLADNFCKKMKCKNGIVVEQV